MRAEWVESWLAHISQIMDELEVEAVEISWSWSDDETNMRCLYTSKGKTQEFPERIYVFNKGHHFYSVSQTHPRVTELNTLLDTIYEPISLGYSVYSGSIEISNGLLHCEGDAEGFFEKKEYTNANH